MPRGHTGAASTNETETTEEGVRAAKALLEDAAAP